jgi:hypothetical protein
MEVMGTRFLDRCLGGVRLYTKLCIALCVLEFEVLYGGGVAVYF